MSGITLKEAEKHLNAWLDAELAVCDGQSYTVGSLSLTKANLSQIREQIIFWRGEVTRLENKASGKGRSRIYRAIPFDS